MSDIIGVYLITGFLGSGKTTFLNRIIDKFPKDKKLTILMNEFGEIGIDGTLIEGEELDMMEISKGSIFCVCVKTDFINGLYELNNTVQPDVIIIESTKTVSKKRLIFNDQALEFGSQSGMLESVHGVKREVEIEPSSTVFIINKTDLAPIETIDKVKKVVHEFHPDPYFFETTYADIPLEQFLFPEEPAAQVDEDSVRKKRERRVLSENELDAFVDDLLDDPDLEITPPDRLLSVTYRWTGNDLEQVKEMAGSLPSSVVRAKGFIEEKGKIYLFSYVMGDWSIEESEIPEDRIEHKDVVVFIGPPESMEDIEEASKTGDWSSLGTFQPMSQVEE